MGSFAIGLLFSRTWLGYLADRNSRKLVVLIGTIVTTIAPLGFLLIKTVPPLMAVRAFHGISIAAFTTGYSALVTDLSPLKQRGELIGYMSLAVPVGMTLGPAAGGFLQAGAGYTALFILAAICGLLAFILSTQVRESETFSNQLERASCTGKNQRNFWQLLQSPALFVPTLVLFLIGLLFGTLVTFLPLFIRDFQLHVSLPLGINFVFNAGLFYTAAALASFSVRIFSGQASDRYGRGLFITFSLICYGLSMIVLAIAKTSSSLLLAAILEGTGAGVLIPLILALICDRSHDLERGRAFAICIGGFDVGIAVAGPILGVFSWQYQNIFALAALFAVMALGLFLSYSNPCFTSSYRFALGRDRDRYSLS
jgi:MFS family permease